MMVDHITHGTRTALCTFMEWIKAPGVMEWSATHRVSKLKDTASNRAARSEVGSTDLLARLNIGQL